MTLLGEMMVLAALAAGPCAPVCSCAGPRAPEDAVAGAAAVFRGVVTRVSDVRGGGVPRRRVAFRVLERWKGAPADTVSVRTGMGGGDCGFPFREGSEYLVYARATEAGLVTGICGRTAPVDQAHADMAALYRITERAGEAGAIAAAGGRVERADSGLEIRGTDGRRLALADDTAEADAYERHVYRAYLPDIGFHLVEVGYYEGGTWLLVNAETTDMTILHGPPTVSPGRTRFAVTSVDLVAGYDENVVQVWRIRGGTPQLEWGLDGGDLWGASTPVWAGEDVLDFTRHRLVENDAPRTVEDRMRLTVRPDGIDVRPAPGGGR